MGLCPSGVSSSRVMSSGVMSEWGFVLDSFQAGGSAGILELFQHTMDSRQQISRHYTMFIYIFYVI